MASQVVGLQTLELPESQAALGVQEGALLPLGELQWEAFQVVHPGVSEVDLEFPTGQGDLVGVGLWVVEGDPPQVGVVEACPD